jgi:hypothetical protein
MGFVDGTSTLQRREGETFILIPKKLVIGNLPVKTRTSEFEKRNIRNLKYSRCSQNGPSGLGNWTIQFSLLQ